MTKVLEIRGLSKAYGSTSALRDVNMSVAHNEYVSLLGPSGAGKTVLLRLIAGFETPDRGSVHLDGKNIDATPPHDRGIGFVFQNFALFPHMNVYDNIAFGLLNRQTQPAAKTSEVHSRVGKMIDLVGLGGLAQRGVHQISGGQRQRVALARTLVTEPRLVLLDEPLGALDANLRTRMRGELRHIRSQLGVTFLHVTGSETEALAMGDRVVVLDRGRVDQFDLPDRIFNQPASPSVAKSLNCYNLFAGRIDADLFLTDTHQFRIDSLKTKSADVAYAIRQDLITIRDNSVSSETDETSISGRYLASEYTGSAFMYFFQIHGGAIVEVENHLSHRAMQDLDVNADYTLVWKTKNALVFG
jgi:ABC-type Fe3+/spermidine/putrescine transport system ATPase subunit